MELNRKVIFNLWLGLTSATLFFYPLIGTLHDNHIILQWRVQNTIELVLAILIIGIISFCCIWLIHNKIKNQRIQIVLLLVLFSIPLISFSVYFLAQLGLKNFLISFGELAAKYKSLVLILLTCFAIILYLLIWYYPQKIYYLLIFILVTLSSINILAAWTIFTHRNVNTKTIVVDSRESGLEQNIKLSNNIIILLFDELSYEYLFINGQIDEKYKNFKRFAEISNVYHQAQSPGKHTLTAIPGLLNKKRYDNLIFQYDWIYRITKEQKAKYLKFEEKNIFSITRNRGFKTYAVGSYLPYCNMFNDYLNECRSFSENNYSTVNDGFSLINPIYTTFILWPRQKPQGLLKNIIYPLFIKRRIEGTIDFAINKLNSKDAFLLFTHIYLPHHPFVFDISGFYWNKELYIVNDINYTRQLAYCDTLLGKLIDELNKLDKFDSSLIIVMSDHNYRFKFPDKADKIPMFVKHPYQKHQLNIYDKVHAEEILFNDISKLK